jgi:hypothetical protein
MSSIETYDTTITDIRRFFNRLEGLWHRVCQALERSFSVFGEGVALSTTISEWKKVDRHQHEKRAHKCALQPLC